jgi:hypothetical protein
MRVKASSFISLSDCPDYRRWRYCYTDKKENQIFLLYKEIHNEAVAKSYMTNGLLIHIW